MPTELVLHSPVEGTLWGLTSFPAFLGRSPACVRVTDPLVSRVHARIVVTGEGFRIEDMGSLNGVAVDGVKVTSRVLHEGSRIKVGDTELVVRKAAGVPVALPAAPPAAAPKAFEAAKPVPAPRPVMPAPRPSAAKSAAPGMLGAVAFGGACVVQGALVAALLGILALPGAADPLGRLVAASALSLQSILALTFVFVAVTTGRVAPSEALRT